MKKRVFEYVKENPGSSVLSIAKALNEEEILILGIVDDLAKEGFLEIHPVPIDKDNDCSCFYEASKKEYKETK